MGSLMYFTETRNDIMYEVSRLSQGIAAPTKGHNMKALRRVMAYLNTVPDMRLCVPRVAGDTWHIYTATQTMQEIHCRYKQESHRYSHTAEWYAYTLEE